MSWVLNGQHCIAFIWVQHCSWILNDWLQPVKRIRWWKSQQREEIGPCLLPNQFHRKSKETLKALLLRILLFDFQKGNNSCEHVCFWPNTRKILVLLLTKKWNQLMILPSSAILYLLIHQNYDRQTKYCTLGSLNDQ